MRFSVLMQVWNEEICLPCALAGLLPVVDELVIVHGGPNGLSTDNTKDIIEDAMAKYPDKIKYIEGTYLREEDGGWDETSQVNDGIELITGDYMMRTAADIIFDEEDVIMIRDIIERFPKKRFFYSPMIDFGGDTDHIILTGHMEVEKALPREIVQADGCVWSMAAKPHAEEVNDRKMYGMVADIDWVQDILYMPHVKRFHYGYVKPFDWLVVKYVRLICAKHHDNLAELQEQGEQVMMAEAINWVRNLKNTLPLQPYTGLYPVNGEPLRDMDVMVGYEEFMERYQLSFLGDHTRPNAIGWTDTEPVDEQIMAFNEGRMPVEQPPLTIDGIGMNAIESFLASVIEHFYPDRSAKLLDIGCGSGKFIAALLTNGIISDATGIDASATMINNAFQTMANVGVTANFQVATIESVEITCKFDVIVANDVLEHLYNVPLVLSKIVDILSDKGMLCGRVPLMAICDCDSHLHHFSTESLRSVLERFFDDVGVSIVDLTGSGENHIKFTARLPKHDDMA